MFSCVWQLCGWVDPSRMENKKGIFQNQQANEQTKIETFVKHPPNQNSSDLQRNVQYNINLKQPNYIVQQINPNFQNFHYENQYKIYKVPDGFKAPQHFHAQYEKSAQSQLQRIPPQSSLALPNASHIWVPQQPSGSVAFHNQPAPQCEYQKISPPTAFQNQAKPVSDKKKTTGTSQLKSPSAKRPPEAPVTKQGWLHKQGSEGLMLWKKRWFVLVEYCLFYYKGPEEEKLLGSILLPSYKVSLCKPEEKISKKFAFKCEHANMRTYILATDSQEQMMHWVQVLNMASLMQKNHDLPKPSSGFSIIHQQQMNDSYESNEQHYAKTSLNPSTPINTHSPSSSLLQDQCVYNQPVYANAPPKPRRLNDGLSSPSPDILDRQNVQYLESRSLSRSPNPIYCKNPNYKHSRDSLNELQRLHDVERRTPETYGRSKLDNRPLDYEDIYIEETMYKRPLSPVAYNHVVKRTNPAPSYLPQRYPVEVPQYPAPQMRAKPAGGHLARPHSADFLEYELNHKPEEPAAAPQRPRPKSSLDIDSRADNDNEFYSRERYAEKMRKSAQYLKHAPAKYRANEAPEYEWMRYEGRVQRPQPARSKSSLCDGKPDGIGDVKYVENVDYSKMYYSKGRNAEYDHFTRSASARLAHQTERIPSESKMAYRDGERKREESMRRLLEWKQRMLQSPLNRKIKGNISYRGRADLYSNDIGYKLSKPKYNDSYIDDFHSKSSNQYNSYSSDDEENKKSGKKIVQSQAGRTLDKFTSNYESPTPAQPLSTTVLSTSTERAKPSYHFNSHETPYTNVIEKLLVSTCQDGSQKPLKFSKKDLDQLSNLSSELAEQMSASAVSFESESNNSKTGATKSEQKCETPDIVTVEENYMPMSPSKRLSSQLGGNYDNAFEVLGESVKIDENHYVEMTQNAVNSSFLSCSFVAQTGEQPMQIFNDDKLEPLYVELRSPETANEEDFPDILITPETKSNAKSDSSDADDEASKDLDSLDTPSQPRFSLSDTFRPASYYLGTGQANADLQDSSDSELVSPPPIPSSPPPLDDMNSVSECSYTNFKLKEDNSDGGRIKETKRRTSENNSIVSNNTDDGTKTDKPQADLEQYVNRAGSSQGNFHAYENLLLSQYESAKLGKDLAEEDNDFSEVEIHEICLPAASTSSEIAGLLQTDSPNFSASSAPYYYSDLSITLTDSQSSLLTLNNQRSTLKCKKDISHIRNPIKCNGDGAATCRLAAEARSASADFLNLADKPGHIDDKNIYESSPAKANNAGFPARNLFKQHDKFQPADAEATVRRSHSLEGLLEDVLKDGPAAAGKAEEASEGSYLWEEDAIWRERLRSASQRHTKSMEDLDTIGEAEAKRKSKAPRAITRGVTYVNENYVKVEKHQADAAKSRIRKDGSFVLDREKLRQWDLMSSAPSDNQVSAAGANQAQEGNNVVVEISEGNFHQSEISTDQQTASGSISMNPRDANQMSTFPRSVSAQKTWIPSNLPAEAHSVTNLSRNSDKDFNASNPRMYYAHQSSSHPNLTPARKEHWPINEKVSVSAGELLGRTHEELVLLLIQLRRQSSQTIQAIENCYNEIDTIQAQLYAMDQTRRMENLQKLEQIKQHLLELEKQYEKGKPLVNLVDNMVKLGSLYRVPQERSNISHHIKDRIEFNQHIQEQRLLAEEKRDWNRLNTSHLHLQEKVQQLYALDRLIHEESGTLQNLQQDKEGIERALGGLRHRLSKGFKDPSEIEMARKQQIMLENELIRVHFMLAQNSKKLEETVSGNAKLEQELMVLKQKLQSATMQNTPQYTNPSDSITCSAENSPELDSDLHKVKKKIGELQQQRQKLSLQVRQLTDRSSNLSQQKVLPNDIQSSSMNKKRIQSLWRETDLDTMSITDHGEYDANSPRVKSNPLYINTSYRNEEYDFCQDTNTNPFTNDHATTTAIPQEKQEIKTVRIVKRESEKRQRDREKSMPPGKWDAVQEEDSSSDSCNVFKPPLHIAQSAPSLLSSAEDLNGSGDQRAPGDDKPHEISPVFKSEAAREIITEMAIQQTPKQPNRRIVPKEKRRHYTAPHDQSLLQSIQQLPDDADKFGMNGRRARDDLDMERALRQRIDAPDVVRSTLINTELKYNERTIDDLLGTPSKINIPERYIPEQLPQLSVEEQEYRLKKVESIKKMLSDTTFISTSTTNLNEDGPETAKAPTKIINKATSKMCDERKQREHLLQLNQILAKQVMEMSKIVAEKATASMSNQKEQNKAEEDEDLSPLTPLPLYQQRDNFYT
ncbi:unnamed protein product [Phyllotreta striolata]|uniref:PH domain-containing protein n=1 Tax=Phyllotreta striolata TaxID=444603 RepID=A0A9N9XKI7_PHYSR|nr:unnamed protein product [Phyllotreta striolata]